MHGRCPLCKRRASIEEVVSDDIAREGVKGLMDEVDTLERLRVLKRKCQFE